MARTTTIATATTTTTSAVKINTLLNLIAQGKAYVIIPNKEDARKVAGLKLVVDNTKSIRVVDRKKIYQNKLNRLLSSYELEHKTGTGCRRGAICDKTYKYLVDEMVETKGSFKVREVFEILHEAGYMEESRGLKHDIVKGVYDALPSGYTGKAKSFVKKKNHITLKLKKMPLTNNFPEKFAAYLAENN